LVLVAALTFPIMSIEQSGDLVTVDVWRAIAAFQLQHLTPLAALVAATTAVFPILELASLCGLLVCATFGWAWPAASGLARVVRILRPWCQLDVLCVALLIAARKLASSYRVHLGLAVPCLALVLLTDHAVARLVGSEALWRRITVGGRGARTREGGPW
jgi:paraquat-inducible protein A